jgi:hypothetical protein
MNQIISAVNIAILAVILIIFSKDIKAETICEFSWDASNSHDVSGYNLYKDGEKIGTTQGLTIIYPCNIGTYTVTAFNFAGIESEESEPLEIKKPLPPQNIKVIVKN